MTHVRYKTDGDGRWWVMEPRERYWIPSPADRLITDTDLINRLQAGFFQSNESVFKPVIVMDDGPTLDDLVAGDTGEHGE